MSAFTLADDLLQMTPETSHPRDLPGRYGRVIHDLERLLQATQTIAVVAGGWAVWRHGYAGRVTQDVDIVVPQNHTLSRRALAPVFGFDYVAPEPQGATSAFPRTTFASLPKLVHRETHIDVDLLPEGGIPGTPSHPAPIAIKHPSHYAATQGSLEYISLCGLIELKLGAARAKDIADIIELIKTHRANSNQWQDVVEYLGQAHTSYAQRFNELVQQAQEEQ